MQIVSCGPESEKEEIKMALMKMITNARKNIYIQTPYLVPDEPMMESLRMAARSGVDVRIMIPCMPDHPFVYRTTLYNAGRLIKEGAKVYIYENGYVLQDHPTSTYGVSDSILNRMHSFMTGM